jgi:hypothetical protein
MKTIEMDVKGVEKRVREIRRIKKDYEAAHAREDDLYEDVLRTIAEGAENAQGLARAALKTKKIDFPRYTA